MRESARFAVTLSAAALFVAGLGAAALVSAVKETGRVVAFGLKHAYVPPFVVQVNRRSKGDRLVHPDGEPFEEVMFHSVLNTLK